MIGDDKKQQIFWEICLIIQAQVDWQQLVQVWVWAWRPVQAAWAA